VDKLVKKNQGLAKRRLRVRRKVSGTSERPRLSVFRSLKHVRAQVIDDLNGVTLAAASSEEAAVGEAGTGTGNMAAARVVGQLVAERARARGIEAVVFDRGGRPYHGRVQAVAEAAREAGLRF
jgi:large subunit ribosomal protein L18